MNWLGVTIPAGLTKYFDNYRILLENGIIKITFKEVMPEID